MIRKVLPLQGKPSALMTQFGNRSPVSRPNCRTRRHGCCERAWYLKKRSSCVGLAAVRSMAVTSSEGRALSSMIFCVVARRRRHARLYRNTSTAASISSW